MLKAKNIINYYVLCNTLKDKIRSGWLQWDVKRARLESVAEHVFGVQNLAIAIYSEYDYDIDIYKVIYMLAIHELEEIIIGDLTILDIDRETKLKKGHQAIKEILADLNDKDKIEQMILEFDERKTKEALFAHYCDKLECDIQAKLYDEEHCVKSYKDKVKNSEFKDYIKEDSWSSMWLEIDRSIYLNDNNFIELLDYIKNNKIKG